MYSMPCYTDSDANRFPEEVEEESPLSLMEQRIEWIFSEWQDAIINDTHEEWASVRVMLYGAKQALIQYGRIEHRQDRDAMQLLSDIAFQHCRDCIAEGKYTS